MKTASGRMLAAIAAVSILVAGVPAAAQASISPSLTVTQSSTQAGSAISLTTDLKFAPSGSDSPRNLTLSLPPGLLSNASINGGACLTSTTTSAACQVGTGTVTATTLGLPLPLSLPVNFYLVAPPRPGDLAGLQLVLEPALGLVSQALGSPGEVTVRPAGNPLGFGLDVAFTNIPNTLSGLPLPISVQELKSTLTGMRMPTSCPSTAARVNVASSSYSDPTTKTTSAPLADTGCTKLPFTPGFTVSAVRDAADSGVQVTTDVTQPTSPAQAASRTVVLTLPGSVLAPNVLAVLNGGILCTSSNLSSCKPVGIASSTSPLYPHTLTGNAYLTGTLLSPGITIVFPPPFALTLTGAVNVASGSTTFQGLPDIPLSDLHVQLTGGPDSVFVATCSPASGVAASTLTTQAGDRTVTVPDPFTVAGCPAVSPGGGSGGGSGGGGSGGGSGGHHVHPGRPHVLWARLSHVKSGTPTLALRVAAGKSAPKLRVLGIALPRGLGFFLGRHHRPIVHLKVMGAKVRLVKVVRGVFVLLLRHPVSVFTIQLRGLGETAGFARAAHRHRLKRQRMEIEVVDASGLATILHPLVSVLRF